MGKKGEKNDGSRKEVDQVLPARADQFLNVTAVATKNQETKNHTAKNDKARESPKTMLRKFNRSCLGLSNSKGQVSVHSKRVVETSLCGCPAES